MALPFGGSGHHSHEQPEDTMDAKTNAVTGAGIKRDDEMRGLDFFPGGVRR